MTRIPRNVPRSQYPPKTCYKSCREGIPCRLTTPYPPHSPLSCAQGLFRQGQGQATGSPSPRHAAGEAPAFDDSEFPSLGGTLRASGSSGGLLNNGGLLGSSGGGGAGPDPYGVMAAAMAKGPAFQMQVP